VLDAIIAAPELELATRTRGARLDVEEILITEMFRCARQIARAVQVLGVPYEAFRSDRIKPMIDEEPAT